jgi:ADP-ribose pyrophosphatase YjhB (NUDIX family)
MHQSKSDSKLCSNKASGILVWKNNKLLLIERKIFPIGMAPPAGHVEGDDDYKSTAKKELKEEVGLDVVRLKLLVRGRKDNQCVRTNGSWHYWNIFEAKVRGNIKPSTREVKSTGWYSREDIKKLALETSKYISGKVFEKGWKSSPGLEVVWYEWFKKLKII